MKNKIYPAFYADTDNAKYMYLNADNYYCLSRNIWDETSEEDDHINDKNITAEYLANTYGEVKSKEHAEFIVKLAEVAKCAGLEVSKHKIANTESFKGIFFNFYTDNGNLWFAFHHESQAKNRGEKQITIPLPPECESVDEWPKVGDEVVFTPNPSIDYKANCTVRFIGSKHIILTDKKGREYSRRKAKALIQKPKTPEQELRDEVIDDLARISQRGIILIGEFLSKYNITKKPQ